MKGFCIVLIVLFHSNIVMPFNIDMYLRCFRIPLYFFLSGLFFKEYGGIADFTVRKTNKLLIPYLFFTYLTVLMLCGTELKDKSAFYLLVQFIEPHNYALWFLRTLFVTYLIYFGFNRLTRSKSETVKIVVLVAVSFLFWIMAWYLRAQKEMMRPVIALYIYLCNLVTAFMALPFFYVASNLRNHGFLTRSFSNKFIALLFLASIVVCVLSSESDIDYREACYGSHYPLMYVSAFSGICCIWCVCYKLNRLPYFSYVGRYSIIVLGTHVPYIMLLRNLTNDQYPDIVYALVVLALMPPTIWLFKKVFPYFTAQKDLLGYVNGRIKFLPNK